MRVNSKPLHEHKNSLSVALMKLLNTRNIEDLVAHNGTDNIYGQ